MDMQSENITNVTEINAVTVTACDIYNSSAIYAQNLNLSSILTFNPGSMISINGIMVDPMALAAGSQTPPSDHEARIHALEAEKKELKSHMVRMQSKIDTLEKWVQL